ncbi:MAG: phosphoribosylglycinamide formyltransferase [Actinobacteria bacterium]|nr:phosphoribosylglycinamide formyltransferase [Actinomycetota bacterium]
MSEKSGKINIAVLASGSGTNFEAIALAVEKESIPARIVVLISDNPEAFALERAVRLGIKTRVVELCGFRDRRSYDRAIMSILRDEDVDLVVLAGYMKLVGPELVLAYKGRIMNIHPALLPSFPGTHGVEDALEYGVKVSGVTVHFVDEGLDTGPVIAQEAVTVKEDDDAESLHNRIHEAEYRIYPEAIRLFAEGRLGITGGKVKVL